MSKREIYISIDIEADGPIPGPYSMLQFGAAAFQLGAEDPRTPIGTFKANLDLLPDAHQDPGTMEWWAKQGDAYANTRVDTQPVNLAMKQWVAWVRSLPGKPVIIGYPVTYDFLWLYWYTVNYGLEPGERCPFGFQGLDLKTMAWVRLGVDYRNASKRNMPQRWFQGAPKHTHDGLDDAIGQGILFVNILKDRGLG